MHCTFGMFAFVHFTRFAHMRVAVKEAKLSFTLFTAHAGVLWIADLTVVTLRTLPCSLVVFVEFETKILLQHLWLMFEQFFDVTFQYIHTACVLAAFTVV